MECTAATAGKSLLQSVFGRKFTFVFIQRTPIVWFKIGIFVNILQVLSRFRNFFTKAREINAEGTHNGLSICLKHTYVLFQGS